LFAIVAASVVGMASILAGCMAACVVGAVLDTLGLGESIAMLVTVWLGTLPPTVAAVVLMMGDPFRGGETVDATLPVWGVRWVEREGGAQFSLREPRIAAREGSPTLGGFETTHPDESLLARDAVRIVSGVLASGLGMAVLALIVWWNVDGATLEGSLIGAFGLAAVSGIPIGILALAWRSWWQTRRALDWSDRIVLEGPVLRSDCGDFHFRDPEWSASVEADRYGHVLTLRDGSQALRIRAPAADLMWVEQQLRGVRIAAGDAEEVPQALQKLTRQSS
jgi:hypothetical protein